MREKREGIPEAVRVAPVCYLEKMMPLPLDGPVPGSTTWKQSGIWASPPTAGCPCAGCSLHSNVSILLWLCPRYECLTYVCICVCVLREMGAKCMWEVRAGLGGI